MALVKRKQAKCWKMWKKKKKSDMATNEQGGRKKLTSKKQKETSKIEQICGIQRCKPAHQSSADTASRKQFIVTFLLWLHFYCLEHRVVLCYFGNNFAMSKVNGKKSEGNSRLLLFPYSSVSWCILLSVV